MLRTYILTAIRSFRRDATVSVINVVGMAVGLACCVLIGLFVYDELKYDRHNEHVERVVRIVSDMTAPDTRTDYLARSSRPVADALREQYPQLETVARLVETSPSIRIGDDYMFEHEAFFAEPEIFDVFTLPLVAGDPDRALAEPYTIAITRSFATRLFSSEDVLGETVVLNDSIRTTVTAVLEDLPSTSHLRFDFLVSYPTYDALYPEPAEPAWLELNGFTYALLRPGTDVDEFRASVRNLPEREYGTVLEALGVTLHLDIERLGRIYLNSDRVAQHGPVSDASVVGLFVIVAGLILLIACTNYTNLATARSLRRAREVGIRKALGAGRRALVGQFLIESTLLTAIAMLAALFLVAATLGWFNVLAAKSLTIATLATPAIIIVLLGLVVVVGVLAGLYPAFVLSRSEAAYVVRNAQDGPAGGARLRKILVVLQFTASIVLITGTLASVRQLNHMRSQDLGFDATNLIVLRAPNIPAADRIRRFELAQSEFSTLPGVRSVSASAATPGDGLPLLLTVAEGLAEGDSRRMHYVFADEHFAPTYRLDVVAGRFLSTDFESDRRESAVINESAVATLGWGTPEQALGRWVHVGSSRREVVGVVRDYHHFALRQPVEPMVIMWTPTHTALTVRVEPGSVGATLAQLQRVWNDHFPGYPFSHSLVLDAFEAEYDADRRLSVIMSLFAGLALLVASLGLFGLVAYTTSQRRKEIGVRRSLGATVGQIVILLLRSVVELVVIAAVLAVPIAYMGLRTWFENFPYPASLGPSLFLTAGIAVLLVAIATVSSLAARAAMADPTASLRRE